LKHTHSLFELHEYIHRVLSLNLPDPMWISCEIHQVNNSKGHYYLTLIQKKEDSDEIVAQVDAILWQRQSRKLRRTLGAVFNSLLKPGLAVRIQARVNFHERYGYKLILEDIDPAFTLGQMALQRAQALEKLQAEGLMPLNKQHALPLVLQKVAVISSSNAAGLQDFLNQIAQNPYGYQIDCRLFEAAVQGERLEEEMVKALKQIKKLKQRYQAVVIIRGGGARLDLAGFDRFGLCKAIAQCPLPVFTGIGHETDEALADLVAHTALKTPTAVAAFLIQHNARFEQQLEYHRQQIDILVNQRIKSEELRLEKMAQSTELLSKQLISTKAARLEEYQASIPFLANLQIRQFQKELDKTDEIITLLSPEATLRRGYTMTTFNGKTLRSKKAVSKGDHITTHLADGSINSEVE